MLWIIIQKLMKLYDQCKVISQQPLVYLSLRHKFKRRFITPLVELFPYGIVQKDLRYIQLCKNSSLLFNCYSSTLCLFSYLTWPHVQKQNNRLCRAWASTCLMDDKNRTYNNLFSIHVWSSEEAYNRRCTEYFCTYIYNSYM